MTQVTDYNFLHLDDYKSLQTEFRLALEFYFHKVYDYEHALRGPKETDASEEEVKQRISELVDRVNYAVFAVPKGLDGQTRGILLGNDKDPGEIDVLFVHESFRSQKLGAALVEEFQRTRPGQTLCVEVAVNNPRAKKFYEGLGFEFELFNVYNSAIVKGHRTA